MIFSSTCYIRGCQQCSDVTQAKIPLLIRQLPLEGRDIAFILGWLQHGVSHILGYAKHKTRPIVTDVAWCVCADHNCEPCEHGQPIDVLFGVWTRVGSRNRVLGGSDSPGKGGIWGSSPGPLQSSQYPAFGRYSPPYSVGGSSGADFRCNLLIFCFWVSTSSNSRSPV